MSAASPAKIERIKVRLFKVPTDFPESDGTLQWHATTMVLVELSACGETGMGFTYADESTARLVHKLLQDVVQEQDPSSHMQIWLNMLRHVRNLGEAGIARMAIAAIDNALWDLRAKLCGVALVNLFGAARKGIPVYGSGGFTSYSDSQLQDQLSGWVSDGFTMVKMKVGTHPEDDSRRVALAREAVGPSVRLFVDANGAYTITQTLGLADAFQKQGVSWFEEPVSSDNLAGLRYLLQRAPSGMDIAAGEYGYTEWYFRRMIEEHAVSVVQADATRCGGLTGFMNVSALCWAADIPLSSHCCPSLHLHACCSAARAIHMEFFHDHVRIERMFFDGFREPHQGVMSPDLSRPGLGLELKEQDAAKYEIT